MPRCDDLSEADITEAVGLSRDAATSYALIV